VRFVPVTALGKTVAGLLTALRLPEMKIELHVDKADSAATLVVEVK
jgi:hypothetical protein